MIETARYVTGKPIKEIISDRRPGDPAVLVASSDKIQKELNWYPKYNSIETIIESAWKWHSTHRTDIKINFYLICQKRYAIMTFGTFRTSMLEACRIDN